MSHPSANAVDDLFGRAAVIFAYYARASRPDVEASMLSPDGSPVF